MADPLTATPVPEDQAQLQAAVETESKAQPYRYDTAVPGVAHEIVQLWNEVGAGIDKSQTVVWKAAVESLDHALQCLTASALARTFVEKYAGPIIGILAEQSPSKIGPHERTCVQDSLTTATLIAAKDLQIQLERRGESKLIDSILSHVFSRKKNFYKGTKGAAWQQPANAGQGHPEVRLRLVDKFRSANGFDLLHRYMMDRIERPDAVDGPFFRLETLHHVLTALLDGISVADATVEQQNDAIRISKASMLYLESFSDETMKKLPTDVLSMTIKSLQKIFDQLVSTRRDTTVDFYAFWRGLVLKMITSPSLPLKLTGWEQVNELIRAVVEHRPPPRGFEVSNAGCSFVNGDYVFAGTVTADGYAKIGADVSYVRAIPPDEPDGGGKKLTLFRCTMRSQQKWWFLSEADEEQPGTDRDVDYYQHKSKEHEEAYPPPGGWITCRNTGVNPPPSLKPIGLLVPPGQELESLEHQLAKWAIENEIVEQVLGDTTIHREVVSRSTVLIKFLANMCTRDEIVVSSDQMATDDATKKEANKYCLQTSHLLFAWKTCTRKADAAVSLQVYQLLVSVLPLCPSNRAIPLLRAIQVSLQESSEKRDYLLEVSEFCSALAAANLVEVSQNNKAAAVPGTALTEDVREEVLNLLWSVLTHPGVSSLKSYDNLKRYVTHELQVEPKGSEHRERFLRSCITVLSTNAEKKGGSLVDEAQALRLVKLTRFILEACPRNQAEAIVSANSGALPLLLFSETIAYLERRRTTGNRGKGHSRKPSLTNPLTLASAASSDRSERHNDELEERLKMLRHVYGLSSPRVGVVDPITMTPMMLNSLWTNCCSNADREALMVFIASASHSGRASHYDLGGTVARSVPATTGPQAEALLFAAFTEEVRQSVFLELFCSASFDYETLGEDGYRSFQFLFKRLREAPCSPTAKKVSLDALWKVCLTAASDTLASRAMKDLLAVYVLVHKVNAIGNENGHGTTQLDLGCTAPLDQMIVDEDDERFGDRMFECLERVKRDLEEGAASAERSVKRCIRILNAAIGRVDSEGLTTASTLARLSILADANSSLADAVKCLPHGMRGQACYRRVGVVAKRPQTQNQITSQHSPALPSLSNGSPRLHPTVRFSLDIHPLETLASIKYKVALHCHCTFSAVKPIQINGRARVSSIDASLNNLSLVPEDSVMDELGVVQGCEIVFVIAERANQNVAGPAATTQRSLYCNDLSSVFFSDDGKFANRLFSMVMGILEALPWQEQQDGLQTTSQSTDIHKLVWDLLLSMPTNENVAARVSSAHNRSSIESSSNASDDAMDVESGEAWTQLLDSRTFDRSVYALLTIDAFLQPAPEALSIFPEGQRIAFEKKTIDDANNFRRAFIDAGGFGAVVRFFSISGADGKAKQTKTRRGNAVALRILKSCLFGNVRESQDAADSVPSTPDEAGLHLLHSLSDTRGLLKSLTTMVVEDTGISSSTTIDVVRLLRLLFQAPGAAESFITLKDAEKFLVILLMWDEASTLTRLNSAVSGAIQVRRGAHDLILDTPALADNVLAWLINAVDLVDVNSESTAEFFGALEKLVTANRTSAGSKSASDAVLRGLATVVCKKLTSCPRPGNDTDVGDVATGVLCGCLRILCAMIQCGCGGAILKQGTNIVLAELKIDRWSELGKSPNRGVLSLVTPFGQRNQAEDITLIDLMGAIFDGFLSPGASSSLSICCDKESRARGFDVVTAAATHCSGCGGYLALVYRIDGLISSAGPKLRHRWGQFGSSSDANLRNRVSKYSGLRNQGCTCYMNSVLQQLFMMPELRDSMCSAPLPTSVRSVGSGVAGKGVDLVGKKISFQWDTGVAFDAVVESFDETSNMHTIRYCPIQVASAGGSGHTQIHPHDVSRLPPVLPDEFVLSEGRPGKETGVFEIVPDPTDMDSTEQKSGDENAATAKETEDESNSRHLLEEVQRTFIHLEEGSRGHCFDPRALVEACACLKLEFDVWQQNDASEFSTKLLDRLEISLKKYAPKHFHHMDHTFGLKQTKQKICKKCGLKSNREEKLLNIDCQIRGKSDIHEALASMTEVEIMEGSNQVFCEVCKENTDTILKSAISTLPNMLILSLKRFDLDFTTFETVKLNSRCAFGQTLNMKKYSLEAVEATELAEKAMDGGDPNSMETDESQVSELGEDPLANIPDEDFEYRLVGVLVHAGVAQGGHYYSFIKERFTDSEDKWYRFDDEDVTPFDPASIETECFGGKVKKETKWPNGQVQTVEQEQFANALMVFYEKVKPNDLPILPEPPATLQDTDSSSGHAVFKPDVRQSNAVLQWQSFLFDSAFQMFLKGLLRFCSLSKNDRAKILDADDSWRAPLIKTLISFVFDVMLYSTDCSHLDDWADLLVEILEKDVEIATSFVQELAKRTSLVSGNWLRTFLLECPDASLRGPSLRIFVAAIQSTLSCDSEIQALTTWIRAWREQMAEFHAPGEEGTSKPFVPVPCGLTGRWKVQEDTNKINDGASSLGIIVSFVNTMLDAMPRNWRFSTELCLLIRHLATMSSEKDTKALKRPMIDAQIPARLICLVARERTPSTVRLAFPAASVAMDVASTQIRPESSASAHGMMPMGSNNVLSTADINNTRGPSSSDYVVLLEALGCLAGIPGVLSASLIRENEERGRQWYSLTDEAIKALTIVFKEHCAPGAPGMGQREIETYLHRSGVDGTGSTQKILDMLSKYPTTGGNDLSLEGFLSYYRDNVQNGDLRLRVDLHTFGFRPDLTLRSREARYFKIGDRESQCPSVQSVARDIASIFKDRSIEMGLFANYGMVQSVTLYTVAHEVSEPLMDYLVAGALHSNTADSMIDRTLIGMYMTTADWEGNKVITGATRMLQVIASQPVAEQEARIHRIMLSNAKATRNVDFGSGILHVLRSLHRLRPTQHYNNEVHWTFNRYIHILKELHNLYPIFQWMNENRTLWSFVERELLDRGSVNHQGQQMRVDYGPRDQDGVIPLENNQSDSDMGGMHDSEDDDESSLADNVDIAGSGSDGPSHVELEGAGLDAVNGTYMKDGFFEGANRYIMDGMWKGERTRFYIFLCNVSNNTKHWYISIVPTGGNPGTSSDIDFYTAPLFDKSQTSPPRSGWVKAAEGKDPSPKAFPCSPYEDDDPVQVGTGTVVEDDTLDENQSYI